MENAIGAPARRPSLSEGAYDGASLTLDVVGLEGGRYGTLHDGQGVWMQGEIEVRPEDGRVTLTHPLRGPDCSFEVKVRAAEVSLNGICEGKPVAERLSKRSESAVSGTFSCSEEGRRDVATLRVWRTQAGLAIEAVSVQSGSTLSGKFEDGRWSVKGLAFDAGGYAFTLERPYRLAWRTNTGPLVRGTCERLR